MSEEKKNYNVEKEPVDLDVMMNTPVPFVKSGGKTYFIKALTIAEVQKYSKTLFIGPPIVSIATAEAAKGFEECFDSHVFDENDKPVKFKDIKDKWIDEGIRLFIKAILKLSD